MNFFAEILVHRYQESWQFQARRQLKGRKPPYWITGLDTVAPLGVKKGPGTRSSWLGLPVKYPLKQIQPPVKVLNRLFTSDLHVLHRFFYYCMKYRIWRWTRELVSVLPLLAISYITARPGIISLWADDCCNSKFYLVSVKFE